MAVLSESLEGLLGSVGGRGKTIHTEANPGEKSRQRDDVEDPRVERVTRRPDKEPGKPSGAAGGRFVGFRLGRRGGVRGVHERRILALRLRTIVLPAPTRSIR